MRPARSVLHVLPHPGGGGERYIDALGEMDGYRFERVWLAPSAKPAGSRASILRRSVEIQRLARRHDILHVHGEVASALCLPALAARPSVGTLHGLNLLRRLGGPRRSAARVNLRLCVSAASRTICVSHAEYEEVRSVVGPRALRRVVVIHNGVDRLPPVTPEECASARSELGVSPAATVGAWIGSLEEHKDPLTPVAAVRELERAGVPVALLVAGDGPLRPEVERSASGAVRVLGYRRDVRQVLAAADFFVLSSVREGFSFALLEAMSLGLPAVVSDVPGNREAVGGSGLVVARGDVAGFAAAFRRVLSGPERKSLGEEGRARVLREFSSEEMVRRTREVYDIVTERQPL